MATKKQDELDRILDAALAKYVAAEPREGLEGRLLSSLRAEQTRVPDRAWWQGRVMAALAAVIVVALALAWKLEKPTHPVVANHPSPARSEPTQGSPIVLNGAGKEVSPESRSARRGTNVRRSQPEAVIAVSPQLGPSKLSLPRLDQFPSPHPLSEQETILASYIARYPEHAALIAQARSEALRRDEAEEMREAAGNDQDSQQHDR